MLTVRQLYSAGSLIPAKPKWAVNPERPDPALTHMTTTAYQNIKKALRQLYEEDNRPWLVGFSGGKDSTMLASLVFDTLLSVLPSQYFEGRFVAGR